MGSTVIVGNSRSGNQAWSGLIVNKRKNGDRFTQEATISPVRDASGRTVNYVAVTHDITKVIELEHQFRQAQKVDSIGRLAGGVAHDLNNLLTPILGYSELLTQGLELGKPHREYVDEILCAGHRARDLVHQLLAFSRKQTLAYQPIDMSNVVTEFESLLQRTIPESIETRVLSEGSIPVVMADIGQIEQVIMNLAVNAADAMPNGGQLTIEVAAASLDEYYAQLHQGVEPGEYVMLSVSDTGCGIDEETREHLFEPFYSTKGDQGTGLGLATVYGIIKQHGGHIWVYSEPGQGTAFKIYLPVSENEQAENDTRREQPVDLTGTETILLVEDNDQVRHLAFTVLQRQGYNVLVAVNGPEALTTLASAVAPVHLLLTDVIMPEMSGNELYLKAAVERPQMKVIYMSGYTDSIIAHHGVLEPGTAFIQKPFTLQTLASSVREALDRE